MSTPRILIYRGGAVGDFIVTCPALELLRERWPAAHIELVGYPHIASLAQMSGYADVIRSLDRSDTAKLYSHRPVFETSQIDYIRSFDLVVCFLNDPTGLIRNNLTLAGARQVLYASCIPETGHMADQLAAALQELAIYTDHAVPRLTVPDDTARSARAILRPRTAESPVVIHPGSGSKSKNWPLRHYLELAARLRSSRPVVFSLGEVEQDMETEIKAAGYPVLEGLNLSALAGCLHESAAYVGNDSGITHMAAAVGVPVTALFLKTSPQVWGPRGDWVQILTAEESDAIEVDYTAEAVLHSLARSKE